MTARVVLVALDGADSRRLDLWSQDTTLPILSRLRQAGRAHHFGSPAGITDDGLWASFQYEVGLGEHGRYHWQQPSLETGQIRMSHLDEVDRPRVWDRLSDLGYRVGVIDIPKCTPPRRLNGIHLSDWEVHGRYFREPRSFPPELAPDIVAKFGPAPPSSCSEHQPAIGDEHVREMLDHLETSIAQKRAASVALLKSDSWDVFMVGFKEAHCAAHALWDIVDDRCAGYDAERDVRLGRPLLRLMAALDSAIGTILEAAGPDADIIVFSTTNFVPNGSLDHLLPAIIERLNRQLAGGWPARIVSALQGERGPPILKLPYNDNCGAMRIRGRHADRIRDAAELLLADLVDENGEPAIAAIDRPSSNMLGARSAQLPDLLVHYVPGRFPAAVTSPRLGRIEAPLPLARPGNHLSGLFTILSGPHARGSNGPDGIEGFGGLIETMLADRR